MTTSTADELLNVAQDLIQKRGYNAFSYKDLAAKVGIKTSSIHYHFPTKAHLAVELVSRYRRMFAEALTDIVQKTEDPIQKLHLFVDLFIKTVGSKRICMGCMLATDFSTLPAEVKKEVLGFFTDTEKWLERVLQEGQRLKKLHFSGPAKKLAGIFLSALEGCMISSRIFKDENRISDFREWALSVLSD